MDYIGRAIEAERLARQISYEPDRKALLEIAQHWRKLADHLLASARSDAEADRPDDDR